MLKAIKPTTTAHKVLIQFWGESSPAVVYTSQTNPEAVEYAVRKSSFRSSAPSPSSGNT
jgi:hypothetical protein